MSGNSKRDGTPERLVPKTGQKSVDSRVRFTREVLGDALMALMHEQPFEQITVQDVLKRAGVGRTTFYTHYSNKDDLFLSDVEDFLESMAGYLERCSAPASRLAPVRELFAHLAEMTDFYKALSASGKLTEVRELGVSCFAKSIARRLSTPHTALPQPQIRAISQALAGALFAMLDGWIFEADKMSPAAAEEIFHNLAWNGIQHFGEREQPGKSS